MTFNQKMMINDLLLAEKDLGNPSFAWEGQSYPCVSATSTKEFEARTDGGGLNVIKGLSLTARLFNKDGLEVFPSLPKSGNVITYRNEDYRINTVNQNVLGVSIQLQCVSDTKDY